MHGARVLFAALIVSLANLPVAAQELLLGAEGNRVRRIDVDTVSSPPLLRDVLVENAAGDPVDGRDVNGMVCALPDGSGRFVMGEDTGQPSPPAGWGVFDADGSQVGKLTATYFSAQPEPFGCAFDANGVLFTTEVGDDGFGNFNGQLLMWFPPYDRFPGPPGAYPNTDAPSDHFCKLASDIDTTGGVAIDAQGRVYVASTSAFQVLRFSPPFPTGPDAAGGCGGTDALGSPVADAVNREVFLQQFPTTFSGLAIAPNGNLYAASVLTGHIAEFDLDGSMVRTIVDPPQLASPPGNPQGIAVGADGTLYYADLDLVGVFPNLGPGPNGKIRRVTFDAQGDPNPPEILLAGLAFPDGVGLLPGNLQQEWRTYGGGPDRLFFNPDERHITPDNVDSLVERWRFPTGAIITASPAVAVVDVPGEGSIQVVYIQSWDGNVYAVRLGDGSELWRFTPDPHPVSFPNVASVHVETVGGSDVVYIGAGQNLYALDAVSGAELWRFSAGTGCVDGNGDPPGLCGFAGERNEIEASAIVAGGNVVFGMDVNDVASGKGGVYAVDAIDGRLAWFFDLESGMTCTPLPGDDIRKYDPYHTEAELGLPAGFLTSRPGCDHPRTPNGCGNVWSTPSVDFGRGHIYLTSSNCDTDTDPATNEPPPPMPPYDEAIFALDFAGVPVWRWRPREVDNDDLAFGAAPNLFTIDFGGAEREVLGVGNKDGTYYVLDRDGANEVSGVAWDDADPSALPYWSTNVVPGGSIGGIPLTSAVDVAGRRVFASTAPGENPLAPQLPSVHAFDADTGAVVWQNTTDPTNDASFAPTSAIPGVVFAGAVLTPTLRAFRSEGDDGSLAAFFSPLINVPFGSAVASGAVTVNGTVLVGTGIGTRTGDPSDFSEITANIPSDLIALCAPGAPGCGVSICGDGLDNDQDGFADLADPGCTDETDDSERGPGFVCDDGVDNDGDDEVDFPDDPGCPIPYWDREDAQCDDDQDNDGDGFQDWDGGAGGGTPDPECNVAWRNREAKGLCGIGWELVLVVPVLQRLRRRRS